MSVQYFTHDNTPTYKTGYSNGATTAFAFWTATASAMPVLTDYNFWTAAAGTVRIKFGSDASSAVIAEHFVSGSATLSVSLDTPYVCQTVGSKLYMETGMNGLVYINATGFERVS